ncbi:MAG: aromatic ring-hydroxylating dioxygenase subunit alpha [Novosphingobium sp.]|nr:MAG: aromatic ring-hydroxylating dioxygenase subunit alpha [Novosphingobium sp.]
MTQDVQAALEQVPFQVTEPKLIPAQRYYDEAFFKLENEKLWPRVWQMACRLEEIPRIGDYTEYTILDRSVIVVRTKDGVKAFHNACRHRGVQLVEGPGNCGKTGFICPFHGWRWSAEGKNTFVFGKAIFDEALLDHAQIDLPQVRCEFWAGCAFINFDDDAPGLIESLGPVVDILDARHVDRLKMDWWYGTVLPTNWKLAMEAFMEGYHVMRTHPQLHDLMPMSSYGTDGGEAIPTRNMDSRMMVNNMIDFYARLSTGMAGMVHETEVAVLERLRDMEVPEDPMHALGAFFAKAQADITADGLARGAPMFDIPKVNQEKPFHDVEFMFPHFFLLPSFAAMSSYRIRPLTAETCLFEIWSLVLRPEDEEFDTPKAPTMLPYDSEAFPEIPMQDYSNLPRQQRGLHAGGFTHMRLSHEQEGMISNYQRLVDGYLAGLDDETLRKGQNAVNSGYNAPILDIGF